MATRQFNIYFIPKKTVMEKYGQVLTQLDIEESLKINWWADLNLTTDKITPILRQFGNVQEWTLRTESLRSFGDVKGNDISVGFDSRSDKIEELSCRIDLRQIDKNIIEKILFIARQFDCLLMDDKGRFFQPTAQALYETIQDSNAMRFVSDPESFLRIY